jgi:DNA primase
MANLASEIKDKLDVADVLGSYLKLEKAGSNFKAKCPFHNEKTPSFFISPKRNSYFCFGCGAKGDIFSFVQNIEGVDFMGALKILANKAGVEIKFEPKGEKDRKERLLACIDMATSFFEKELASNKEALDYLKKRGLLDKTIKNWRLGFAPKGWHFCEEYLISKGFKREEMFDTGLIKKGEGGKIYDVFRSRVMFPIFDNAGRVIAFSGRIFGEEDKDTAKYLNTPETEIFKKSEVFYGYNVAKIAIRRLNFAIIVEGQMDMLMSQQTGWDNTIATSGTALTEDHLAILKRGTENLVIAYDNDKAGVKASARAFEIAIRAGFNVKACRIEEGKDPADLALKDPELLKKAIKESEPAIAFFWKNLLSENLSKDKLLSRFRTEIIPLLASEKKRSEVQRVISDLSNASTLGLREDLLIEEISKFVLKNQTQESTNNNIDIKTSSLIERTFGLLFSMENGSIKNSSDIDFKKELSEKSGGKFDSFMEKYLPDKDRFQFEAEAFWSDGNVKKDDLIELIDNFEEDCLRERLTENMQKLSSAEKGKNIDTKSILSEIQEITVKLNRIKGKVKKEI